VIHHAQIPWTDDLASCFSLQLQVSSSMIMVVMRVENVGQLPALLFKNRKIRGCIRGIDGSRCSRGRIMDQVTIIVTEARELLNLPQSVNMNRMLLSSPILEPQKILKELGVSRTWRELQEDAILGLVIPRELNAETPQDSKAAVAKQPA
jgi:hypothetical protein